jgi:hypothetical protein
MPLTAAVTVLGPNEYNIRIDGVYSLGTYINIYMDDTTIATLNETTC